jgi:hypothetical protein
VDNFDPPNYYGPGLRGEDEADSDFDDLFAD